MAEEHKTRDVYSNRKKPDASVPLFLHESLGQAPQGVVEEESCCSAHSTLVSDQNTTFTALKLHGNVTTLKGSKLTHWPQTTDVACWYDTYTFTTTPVPLAHHYDEQARAYVIYGNLCSVECALAYMHREGRHHDLWERVVLFEDMMNAVFKVKVAGHDPAPPFLTLTRFGGFFSIEEYRATFTTMQMSVISPPFIMYPLIIQEKHKKKGGASQVASEPEQETVLSTGHVLRGLRRPQKTTVAVSTVPTVATVSNVATPASGALAFDGRGTAELTVGALSMSSDDEEGVVQPCEAMDVCTVAPLDDVANTVQADQDMISRITQSGRGRGRGRGRGNATRRGQSGGAAASVSRRSTPSNTLLTSFLVVNKK